MRYTGIYIKVHLHSSINSPRGFWDSSWGKYRKQLSYCHFTNITLKYHSEQYPLAIETGHIQLIQRKCAQKSEESSISAHHFYSIILRLETFPSFTETTTHFSHFPRTKQKKTTVLVLHFCLRSQFKKKRKKKLWQQIFLNWVKLIFLRWRRNFFVFSEAKRRPQYFEWE